MSMKKNIVPILVAALIIAQIVSLSKINDLQNQLNSARFSIDNISNNTTNEINGIYANVDSMLKKEASLIEIASITMGTLDKENLTIPITFSITPKEVSDFTTVSLDIEGEIITMEKSGTTFSATVSRDIFSSATPLILIDEGGVMKTTQDDRLMILSMKDSLLPSIHPRINGESRYGGGSYKRKGTLTADFKNVMSEIVFTEMRFIVKVDGDVVSDEVIFRDSMPMIWDWEVDKTIPLADGQTCIMTVIASDSAGLEHHFTVDYFVGGANAQREPWFDDEEIYSADGKLLRKLEYKY